MESERPSSTRPPTLRRYFARSAWYGSTIETKYQSSLRVYGEPGRGAVFEARCCEIFCVHDDWPRAARGPNALERPAAARRRKVRRLTSSLRPRTRVI